MIISGFAFGMVIALVTRASMMSFGAEAMIPEAIALGMFKDAGALITALLVSGRDGTGIGAQLAGMRVTERIDALETLGVDSFKYLVGCPHCCLRRRHPHSHHHLQFLRDDRGNRFRRDGNAHHGAAFRQ